MWLFYPPLFERYPLADYKVPQVLRNSGILVYSEELAGFVDNVVEVPQGSEMEVEIRAATVWAVELLCRILIWDFPQICPMALDGAIWHRGQVKHLGDKPYHRTLTTAY